MSYRWSRVQLERRMKRHIDIADTMRRSWDLDGIWTSYADDVFVRSMRDEKLRRASEIETILQMRRRVSAEMRVARPGLRSELGRLYIDIRSIVRWLHEELRLRELDNARQKLTQRGSV